MERDMNRPKPSSMIKVDDVITEIEKRGASAVEDLRAADALLLLNRGVEHGHES